MHNSCLTVIGVHEMHGRMHPNYCQISILLVVDLCSSLAYSMMIQPLPIAGKFPIKSLVAGQLPTNMCTPYYTMHTLSQIMFGVCVMLILLIPSRLIPSLFPSFLPYNLTLTGSANPLREVQLEPILLQFIVPTLLEHGNCRAGLKFLIKSWADLSARILYVCI